jgi:hypothetical protein
VPLGALCGSSANRRGKAARRWSAERAAAHTDAAMSIFFMPIIASNARLAPSPPAANASVSARGLIQVAEPASLRRYCAGGSRIRV